jgi:hypothetical protein
MARHRVVIDRSIDVQNPDFIAECSCGWEGEWHSDVHTARTDAEDHLTDIQLDNLSFIGVKFYS